MSLSSDPAFSTLKDNFVCGVKDITNESYSGVSGRHEVDGQAVNTTNGAGPHNIQMFVLASDGTVLTCLPGYWNAEDLVGELELARQLNTVYHDPSLSRTQKNQMFSQMQMAHLEQHSLAEHRRSRMQSFDQKFEAKNRLNTSDTIAHPELITDPNAKMIPQEAFKTTDEIMHARMAARPFVPYNQFDVAAYADYGRPKYDKHEDLRDSSGRITQKPAPGQEQLIGNTEMMNKMKRGKRAGMANARAGGQQAYTRGDYVKTYFGPTATVVGRRLIRQGIVNAMR